MIVAVRDKGDNMMVLLYSRYSYHGRLGGVPPQLSLLLGFGFQGLRVRI